MEYYINLNGHFKKHKNSLVIGIVLIVIALGYFLVPTIDRGFRWSNALLSLLFIFNGMTALARAKGCLLLTKSYLKVNDESLSIKVLSQRKNVLWKDIETIDLTENKLRIRPSDKNFQHIAFKNLDAVIVNEIRAEISRAAELKNISIKQ